MKNRRIRQFPIHLLLLILWLPMAAHATNAKVGTSGAQFLKIGASARPTAMGDAFVGIADDVNAVYFNPGGLGFLDRAQVTAMRTQWFQGMDYDFGAFALPLPQGALGFSISTLQASDLEKRSTDESSQGTFGTLDAAYSAAYGRKIGDTWSLGVTGRYLNQKIDVYSATAWGADVGVLKKLENRPITFGLALRNMGGGIKFVSESDPQPFVIDAGAGIKLLSNKLLIGVNVQKPRDNDAKLGAGGEYTQKLQKDFRFSVRGDTRGCEPIRMGPQDFPSGRDSVFEGSTSTPPGFRMEIWETLSVTPSHSASKRSSSFRRTYRRYKVLNLFPIPVRREYEVQQ